MLQALTIYLLYHLRYYNTYNLFIYLFLIDYLSKQNIALCALQNSVMKIIQNGIPKQTSQVNSKYMIMKNKLPRFFLDFKTEPKSKQSQWFELFISISGISYVIVSQSKNVKVKQCYQFQYIFTLELKLYWCCEPGPER